MPPPVPFTRRFSAFALLRAGLSGQRTWPPMWRTPDPRRAYQAIVVGGGGHGLATAYYLAREHGLRDVAVIEKGWIGGGNIGRNTTVVRSNYYYADSTRFYRESVELYERLSRELNDNIMFSQRGIVTLAFSPHEINLLTRQMNAMQLNGIPAEMLSRDEIRRRLPALDLSETARFRCLGGLLHASGGTARHDAVAWGYARTATGVLELFPAFSRLRLMRHWGGTVDLTPDRSPIIDRTPVEKLYVSAGWGTGGFKAVPAGGRALAHLVAHGRTAAAIDPSGRLGTLGTGCERLAFALVAPLFLPGVARLISRRPGPAIAGPPPLP